MIRGNLLQKSEIAYSKAISKAVALRSSQLVALHREQIRLMQELEKQALREESKSHHDFLSTYQAALHHSPNPSRRIWLPPITPYCGNHLHHLHPFSLPGHPQQKNNHPLLSFPCQCPNSPLSQKGGFPCQSHRGACL